MGLIEGTAPPGLTQYLLIDIILLQQQKQEIYYMHRQLGNILHA